MIYIYDEISKFTAEDYEKYSPLLSEERIKKRNKFVYEADRVISMLAYLLLRYAAFSEFSIDCAPEFSIGSQGKPMIENSDFHFNLSHCRSAVMCGVSNYDIGVDIQENVKNISGIQNMVLTEKELAEVKSETKRFTDLWTLKESYGKKKGCGIIYELKEKDFSGIYDSWTRREDSLLFCGRHDEYSYGICSGEILPIKFISYQELVAVLDMMKRK